ncbi:MAG: hypothetical protein U0805_19930 [Pirellulales bacterium]
MAVAGRREAGDAVPFEPCSVWLSGDAGRLAMVDQAEQLLRSLGFRELRVRYHADDMARIEVPVDRLPEFCEGEVRSAVVSEFTRLGFKFIALDLAGFRSGGFAKLLPSEMVRRFS